MALTYTPAGQKGFKCPDFKLTSVNQKLFDSQALHGHKAIVIAFICNHCPYVQAIEDRLIQLSKKYVLKDVEFVGICANDPTDYPEDAPDQLLQRWLNKKYGFPYLIDETQEVAKAFGAVCTPDFFVFDSNLILQYRGRLDDSWKNQALVKRQELSEALDAILSGLPVNSLQHPSMGCSIKWK